MFFVLAFVFSVPFLLVGALTGISILPGLPISALGAVCPVLAALVTVAVRREPGGLGRFLRQAFGAWPRGWWWAPTLLLTPAVAVVSWFVLRLTGTPVPVPEISPLTALALVALFIVGAPAEELGWSSYVTDPLQTRWGALGASLVLGAVWVVFHIVPLLQVGRSAGWIAGWSLGTLAMRVIMVWLFTNTGHAVIAVSLFHATQNLSWQLFPVQGSFYDPLVTGVIFAVAAVMIVLGWGPRTLARGLPSSDPTVRATGG